MNFAKGYGSICPEDAGVIEDALAELCRGDNLTVRVLEIGMHGGGTARGMKAFIEANHRQIDYWGIEPGILPPVMSPQLPFPEANVVIGRSEFSFHLVPDNFDLVFVDGNHARNSVILDTLNYKDKVRPGGFMVFHDAGPGMQGQDYQYAGPVIPEFHVAVLEAHQLMRWPEAFPEWKLRMHDWPKDHNRCGAISYQRVA